MEGVGQAVGQAAIDLLGHVGRQLAVGPSEGPPRHIPTRRGSSQCAAEVCTRRGAPCAIACNVNDSLRTGLFYCM